jgi:hypothetical protein
MRAAASLGLMAGFTLLLATACADSPATGPETDLLPASATVPGACAVLGDVARDARGWFPQPEQRSASDLIRDLRTACTAGIQSTVTSLAWQVLGLMESLHDQNRGGDPALGSILANELLSCVDALCTAGAVPGLALGGPLAAAGLFAVRSGGTAPALASARELHG